MSDPTKKELHITIEKLQLENEQLTSEIKSLNILLKYSVEKTEKIENYQSFLAAEERLHKATIDKFLGYKEATMDMVRTAIRK